MAKRKIAVLGGGASSLFAVWKLVSADGWTADDYDITVYQVGWRLGGKGASGRNAGAGQRIEEHGLHLMFGFYDNVFDVIRGAYREVYGDETRWQRMFKSANTGVSMIHYLDPTHTAWDAWSVPFPSRTSPLEGMPGDRRDVSTPAHVLASMWAWLEAVVSGELTKVRWDVIADVRIAEHTTFTDIRARITAIAHPGAVLASLRAAGDKPRELIADIFHHAERFLGVLPPTTAATPPDEHALTLDAHEQLLAHATALVQKVAPSLAGMLTFVTAVMRGLFADLVIHGRDDWFALDEEDLRAWVQRHGGDPTAPPVDALYDAVFSSYSQLGAGSILQAALKAAFLFRTSAIFKMQAGMGDSIFAPLYRALRKKGVKFEFFHRVSKLELDDTHERVERVLIERQVEGASAYEPLVQVDATLTLDGAEDLAVQLDCWPNAPRWDQLPAETPVEPSFECYWTPVPTAAPVVLTRGADFDDVILGISVAALPELCADLLAADPPFALHVSELARAATATQGVQLWTVAGKTPVQPSPLIIPNWDPLDTIAEMSHLVPVEHQDESVTGLYYLCSALQESSPPPPRAAADYPGTLARKAADNLKWWVGERAPLLWKNLAITRGGTRSFDWDALYDPKNRAGDERLEAQYVNTPDNLSDRYVLAPPMTNRARLVSNGTRFRNLYITGDWIKTSLSIGCLEAAAMAGVQAARAYTLEHAGAPEVAAPIGDWIGPIEARPPEPPPPRAPLYRRRNGELIQPPPFRLRCDNLFMFVLEAERGALEKLCRDDLGFGTPRYTPFADVVVLYAARLDNRSIGTTCSSLEVGIWIPVIDKANALLTYSPYVWIDSATSTMVGRGIYGWAKATSQLAVPTRAVPSAIRVTSDALVSAAAGDPRPWNVQPRPILTVETSELAPHIGPLSGWEELAKIMTAAARKDPLRDAHAVASLASGMRSVFLKQLPGVDGATAAYQAIVEATIKPALDTLRGAILPGDWRVTIPVHHEPNLVDTLGLKGEAREGSDLGRTLTIKPLAQIWAQFEGELQAGQVIWDALGR